MRTVKCQCARCKLYVRATLSENPEYDIFEADGITKKPTQFENRDYQNALIEIAKRKNIIACLPTGSGKTFIAFKLIEHFQDDIISSGKKVIFLANTVPLVAQQAEFFARNSMLRVKHLTGDMEVDYWSEDKWGRVIEGFHILAMTTQIFLNIVRPAIIKFSEVVLIIFDECHHAVKDHPMKHVMQKYHETKIMEPNYPLPRILGMTATIIKGNCEVHQVPSRVEELERTMQAKAVTYKDYQEVLKHSTSSRIQKYCISSAYDYSLVYLVDKLEVYSKDLNKLRNERKKLRATTTIDGIDPTLNSSTSLYLSLKKPTAGDLRIAVDDVKHSCLFLGPYCGLIAINLKLAFIEFCLMDITDGIMKQWYLKVRELFETIKLNIQRLMEGYREESKVVDFATKKLRKLIEIVKQEFGMNDPPPCMFDDEAGVCGIVFVGRRVTAQVLAWYLQDLANFNEDYQFIRANFVVGTSRSGFESVENTVYSKKQQETIRGFRNKKYNLLIATAVLEEGIDVPSCNLIVRFDKIPSYTSYIQSMGRARKPNALFCALIDEEKYCKDAEELDQFQRINVAMVRHLIANVENVDEEPQPMEVEHGIEPFCPGGTADSPSVTMESAMDVIDRYCNLLPCDGISTLQSLSWWTEDRGGMDIQFQGHLKLPMNSIIRGTVTGVPMNDKHLARLAVNFETAKMLYDFGALDDQLLPSRPKMPEKIDVYFKALTGVPGAAQDGEIIEKSLPKSELTVPVDRTEKRPSTWYRKKVPEIFKAAPPGPKDYKSCKVYRIWFDLTEPNPNRNYQFRNIYNLDKGASFALVAFHSIPDIGSFPMYGGFGIINASLQLMPKFPTRSIPFDYAPEFQEFVFTKILGLNNRLLQQQRDPPFFIIPIKQAARNRAAFAWDVDTQLMEDIRAFSGLSRLKRPNETMRQNRTVYPSKEDYKSKFEGSVVTPWYKKGGSFVYCVDTVEVAMTPKSSFHDANFSSYKTFIESEYKTKVYDNNQPLLKTKLAVIGKGPKQLNYLLEKFSKEDEFPVYLVPELVHKLPIPVSFMVQLKLIPSFLHRLYRLLIVNEILTDIGKYSKWDGILIGTENSDESIADDVNRLTAEHEEKKVADMKRRQEFKDRLTKAKKPIPEIQNIQDRELHYEFIHPNKITLKDIKLFHEAVSEQHAAKKLLSKIDPAFVPDSIESEIELTPIENISLKTLEPDMEFSTGAGPTLLAVMEALTLFKANDGVSNVRLNRIGWSFLNFVVSTHIFINHSDWSEPLMCQLRNRLLSVTHLCAIAKKRNLAEIMAASDFYPSDTWIPPGFKMLRGRADLGEITAEQKVPFRVYDALTDVELKNMNHSELENHVIKHAKSFQPQGKMPGLEDLVAKKVRSFKKPKPPMTGGIFSSYTHAEVSDYELSGGLCALIGAFFIKCGAPGALKLLDWLGFRIPDSDGEEQMVLTLKPPVLDAAFLLESAELKRLVPLATELEKKLGYTFNNRNLLVEALTHPTYLANNMTACYQRLEFLGDAILDALLTNYVYSMTIKDSDGSKYSTLELSEINKCLVNNITYASLAVRYGLHKHLLSMSKALTDMIDNFVLFQEASSHEVVGHFTLISDEEVFALKHMEVPKVLGDIFEAFAGAIYIDSGGSLDTVWKVFYRLMEHEIDGFSAAIPKSPLQELYAEFPDQVTFMRWTSQKMRDRGREHAKITVGPHGSYFGSGTNYTRAKEAAAKVALKMIKEEDLFIKDRENASNIMLLC